MLNVFIWAGFILLALAVILSSSWFGGGYVRSEDEAVIEARRLQKKQRMKWALRCIGLSVLAFVLALIVYNLPL
ncbi:hypothetical protein ACE3MZ_04645 [Paenibacillus sp. WLX1005]|uniref:hypothetical protein n=1 Tax=unclassified Paenibacillus TaxID=185978 RepID=UPI003983E003